MWGDSHAEALISAIGAVASLHRQAVAFFGTSGCPSVLNLEVGDVVASSCASQNADVLHELLGRPALKTVILVSRYAAYIDGASTALGPAERGKEWRGYLKLASGVSIGRDERLALFGKEMRRTVDRLLAAGKKVVIVYPIPEVGYVVPTTLARLAMMGRDPAEFTTSFRAFQERQRDVFSVLDGLGPSDHLIRIYPHRRLCNDMVCVVYAQGTPLYYDDDHLSLTGADFVAPLFEPVFANPNAVATGPAAH